MKILFKRITLAIVLKTHSRQAKLEDVLTNNPNRALISKIINEREGIATLYSRNTYDHKRT